MSVGLLPRSLTACILISYSSLSVSAQDWTRFRGPNGTGLSDASTIPAKWSDKDFNWRVPLPGGGHSAPVIWGDRVFVTSAFEDSARRVVLCLRAGDGQVAWTREFDSTVHRHHEFNSFASSTPTVDSERLYVCWATPKDYFVVAFDHRGNELWRRDIGAFGGRHANGTSPIVYGDLLILAHDQPEDAFLIALDRKTGVTRWKTEREGATSPYATPCVRERPGQPAELVFAGTAHGLSGVDPQTGRVNWQFPGLFDKRVVSSPVLAGDLVIGTCGSGGGGNYVVAVRPGQAKDGEIADAELVYSVRRSAPYVPTPVVKDDLMFLWSDGGIVTCVEAATGQEHWRERVGGRYFGSPVCVNDRLYAVSDEGDVVVLAASKEYAFLARNALGELSRSTPAVAAGRMYVRTFSHLVSVGGSK